jgi:hypothetical protein
MVSNGFDMWSVFEKPSGTNNRRTVFKGDYKAAMDFMTEKQDAADQERKRIMALARARDREIKAENKAKEKAEKLAAKEAKDMGTTQPPVSADSLNPAPTPVKRGRGRPKKSES